MVINDDIDKKIEKFFRKRILQNLSSGIKLDGMTLIQEAALEFDLNEPDAGLALSIILNDVWEMMNLPNKDKEENEEKVTRKTELSSMEKNEIKFKILLHMYKDPYAPIEKIADDLNIDVDLIQELFGKEDSMMKKRFSPKQRRRIVDTTIEYLSHFPEAVPEDLEEIFFHMFERDIDVRKVLSDRVMELEKRGEIEKAKTLKEFIERKPKTKKTLSKDDGDER